MVIEGVLGLLMVAVALLILLGLLVLVGHAILQIGSIVMMEALVAAFTKHPIALILVVIGILGFGCFLVYDASFAGVQMLNDLNSGTAQSASGILAVMDRPAEKLEEVRKALFGTDATSQRARSNGKFPAAEPDASPDQVLEQTLGKLRALQFQTHPTDVHLH